MGSYEQILLSYVVPVYVNQNRGDLVESLLRRYSRYDPDTIGRVEFIIVDDGSPVAVEIPPDLDLNIILLRVREDIPWNQPGARNLGVVCSHSEKVLITDIDHEFPETTMQHLVRMKSQQSKIYTFARHEADGVEINRHPNTFLLSRSTFLRYFGYDEDFCGAYGYDDLMFRKWQQYNGTRFVSLSSKYFCLHRAIDRYTEYHSLERDISHNESIARKKHEEWGIYGYNGGHSRKFLAFGWDHVLELQRIQRSSRPICRLWRPLWLWRQLTSFFR